MRLLRFKVKTPHLDGTDADFVRLNNVGEWLEQVKRHMQRQGVALWLSKPDGTFWWVAEYSEDSGVVLPETIELGSMTGNISPIQGDHACRVAR